LSFHPLFVCLFVPDVKLENKSWRVNLLHKAFIYQNLSYNVKDKDYRTSKTLRKWCIFCAVTTCSVA